MGAEDCVFMVVVVRGRGGECALSLAVIISLISIYLYIVFYNFIVNNRLEECCIHLCTAYKDMIYDTLSISTLPRLVISYLIISHAFTYDKPIATHI